MADSFSPSGQTNDQIPQPADFANINKDDLAIISAKSDRKRFINALDTGTLACLPDQNGFADTKPAVNVVNNTIYRGSGQLLLKVFQRQNGFPTAEYCTFDQIEKANNFSGEKKAFLMKGSKGISLNFLIAGEQKSIRLFNIAQVRNPEIVRSYADHLALVKENYLHQKYGDQYHPKANTVSGLAISCTSSEPSEYMGQYLAALSLGRQFRATAEQGAEFTAKTKDFIFERNEAGHINPFNLNRLGSRASHYCKDIIPQLANPDPASREQQTRATHRATEPSMGR
jgi:hypothetical protein